MVLSLLGRNTEKHQALKAQQYGSVSDLSMKTVFHCIAFCRRDKDNHYFKLAEEYLYGEFSVVLGMSYDDTKSFVISEVSKLV